MQIIESAFETWSQPSEEFDLVFAATSWQITEDLSPLSAAAAPTLQAREAAGAEAAAYVRVVRSASRRPRRA